MKYSVYLFIAFSILFSGCDYLDVVPKNDVETIETIFEKREQADKWLQSCYVLLSTPVASVYGNPAFAGADEMVAGNYARQQWKTFVGGLFIGDGLQMAQEPYGNIWKRDLFYAGIRYCNIFVENIDRVYNMEEREKKLWVAEIKALKAHFYFELMRRYGPIILVPENIDANAETSTMRQPRSPIDSCVNAMVALLDEAIADLPPLKEKDQTRWAYYCQEAAATLKAQVLLYAASPLFNGNTTLSKFRNKVGEQLFNQAYDPEKWKRAALAADEAIQVCLHNGKQLISGNSDKDTKLLNVMVDLDKSVLAQNFENTEAIFMVRPQSKLDDFWFSWTLPYLNSYDKLYGCFSPSMKMVEMYYTEHGLPIDADKEWDYTSRYQMSKEAEQKYRDVIPLNEDVLNLHLRREPRFYANIAADRCYWERGELMIVKAYREEAFGTKASAISNSVPQNLSGYWLKKGSYSNIENSDYYMGMYNREEAFIVTRLAELYLMKAEAWNEYEGPEVHSHVYEPLNSVRERAGIPDVEKAWQNYSNNPAKITTKEGMREIIRQEWNVEFAFEGRRFWNLRRWMIAAEELNEDLYGWNILGENAQQFYNNFEGPVVVWSKRKFIAPRDYFFPIRSEEVMISGCVQNPEW